MDVAGFPLLARDTALLTTRCLSVGARRPGLIGETSAFTDGEGLNERRVGFGCRFALAALDASPGLMSVERTYRCFPGLNCLP
jgi:hypothetical protein